MKVAAGPAKYAIEFDLTGARAEHRDEPNDHAGAGFHWSPRPMQSAQSACLAYSVFIPEAFQFGGGGRLPGLTGEIDAVKPLLREGETAAATPEATPFAVNTGWDKDGGGQMLAYGPKFDGGAQFRGRSAFSLGRGKWMRVEQEVVLNTPGSGDGALRLWLDGDLKIDASVAYRDQPAKITGVVSEVVPTGKDVSPKAKDHKISVTPYTIYWK